MTKRVTGLGGVFFKAKDRAALGGWYKKHLGLPVEPWGGVSFRWRDEQEPAKTGATIWSPFEEDTDYFAPSEKPFM
ncbi:MAG TPA: hypothetical protein VKC60_11345, partial [Opitutaceae bacterium]|nr:hypothetical protein [Opitutaceae bacterium]